MSILKHKVDKYDGINIDQDTVPINLDQFECDLQFSLNEWKNQKKKRAVWLHLKLPDHSYLLPIAIKYGFEIHHAQKAYIKLTCWLPNTEDEPNKIPDYASHYIGVGGLVINDKNEILVIQEKYFLTKPIWKFPGGLVEAGEDLAIAVVREVKEECGIDCEFISVLCFRHNPNYMYGRGDIYFVMQLKPITFDIKPQRDEIADIKWMPLEDYVKLNDTGEMNKKAAEVALHTIHPVGEKVSDGFTFSQVTAYNKSVHKLYHPIY